ncbi:757c7644-b091-46a8-8a87-25968dafb91e [Thermothielavioides terrestris]|uniref:757c7644-b091-46a8-8a87-25968dafb91e n=1 Tax=Thermothielavioides terrestris TaxID=2587410 RepID=A0A446B905_9PEZI|nr:757c7644-b091-46a8-8a87-25968dafb91e [Thermothielavioides terrestris]
MPVRTRNPRSVTNENDENSNATARVTRAKAAATLNVDELAMPTKPLLSKKTAAHANPARKRAVLGDVSNVTKVEAADGKKPVGKPGLVSKAAQPTGIQKKTTATRSALTTKEINKKAETKRTGPGSIVAQKRKTLSTAATSAAVKENTPEEGKPSRKKVHTLDAETKTNTEAKAVKPAREEAPSSPELLAVEPAERPPTPEAVRALDSEDLDDPLMVAEYANEIFEYLRDLECNSIPNPQYMSHQDDLEWKTRGILVDWLVEVHTRFGLLPETLFLAVNIVDRFLSEKVVQLDRLQLVGITAMFIASKYEEVLSPHVANFRHVADDGFSEAEILGAERFVLATLNYDLSYPNPMNFLRRISKADNYDIQSRTIGKYLMEISLLDHRLLGHRPSHIAAAAMYLARLILDRGEWDETLEYYAGYSEEEIQPVVLVMIDYMARPVIHEAFFKKYASKRFLKASILTRQWAKKNAHLYGIVDTHQTLDEIS